MQHAWNSFINVFTKNQPQTDFQPSVKSLLSVPSTRSLSSAIWQRSWQHDFRLTLHFCTRGSLNGNISWFSAIQSCYFQGILNLTERSFLLDQPFRVFRNFFFRNIQKKCPKSTIAVAPNLSNISGRKRL